MKTIKKISCCSLLLGAVFLSSCQNKTSYVSNCPISEIREMQPVKIIIEQYVIRKENIGDDIFYPDSRIIQTKQQAIKIIENPKNWQPCMEFTKTENIKKTQEAFTKSVKPLKDFDCVFSMNKKVSFIDESGNVKWMCFVNARSLKR